MFSFLSMITVRTYLTQSTKSPFMDWLSRTRKTPESVGFKISFVSSLDRVPKYQLKFRNQWTMMTYCYSSIIPGLGTVQWMETKGVEKFYYSFVLFQEDMKYDRAFFFKVLPCPCLLCIFVIIASIFLSIVIGGKGGRRGGGDWPPFLVNNHHILLYIQIKIYLVTHAPPFLWQKWMARI